MDKDFLNQIFQFQTKKFFNIFIMTLAITGPPIKAYQKIFRGDTVPLRRPSFGLIVSMPQTQVGNKNIIYA